MKTLIVTRKEKNEYESWIFFILSLFNYITTIRTDEINNSNYLSARFTSNQIT